MIETSVNDDMLAFFLPRNMQDFRIDECVTFRRTKDSFGGLSNMAGGFPIHMGDIVVSRSEHLYQALRYPDHPELQREIIAISNPIEAKQYAYEHLSKTRMDWMDVRVAIMLWCLQLKLLNNLEPFGRLLLVAIDGYREIVEVSRNDDFWGAKPTSDGIVRGLNVLGRLLWGLGRMHKLSAVDVQPLLPVSGLRLFAEDAMVLAIDGLALL